MVLVESKNGTRPNTEKEYSLKEYTEHGGGLRGNTGGVSTWRARRIKEMRENYSELEREGRERIREIQRVRQERNGERREKQNENTEGGN